MTKPATAQELIDWIASHDGEALCYDEAIAIILACRAFLEALEEEK